MRYAQLLDRMVAQSGMTMDEISKLCRARGKSVSSVYIGRLRRGLMPPPSEEITRVLAEVLGGSAEELLLAGQIDRTPERVQNLLNELLRELGFETATAEWMLHLHREISQRTQILHSDFSNLESGPLASNPAIQGLREFREHVLELYRLYFDMSSMAHSGAKKKLRRTTRTFKAWVGTDVDARVDHQAWVDGVLEAEKQMMNARLPLAENSPSSLEMYRKIAAEVRDKLLGTPLNEVDDTEADDDSEERSNADE